VTCVTHGLTIRWRSATVPVYYRDASAVTARGDGIPRWGDYITVRPSAADARRFAGFGYYTDNTALQRPFYLSYGRP
jgi:hypothetical protein